MKKTLTRKFIYVLAALSILAMLVPAMAIPAYAQGPSLFVQLVNSQTQQPIGQDGDGVTGWNVSGSTVSVTAQNLGAYTLAGWDLVNVATAPVTSPASFVYPTAVPGTSNPVYVAGVWGDAIIKAYLTSASGNLTLFAEKKWGQISDTVISATPPGGTYVTWNEASKTWSATATVTDLVNGTFFEKDNPAYPHVAQGAILNWYLVTGTAVVNMTPADSSVKKAQMAALPTPTHVGIGTIPTKYTQTVTGNDGKSTITLVANGEEAVQVVVVPEYPMGAIVNVPVTPELLPYDFFTTEFEVVPQVRWAGEKIVLEKYWGPTPVSANNSFFGKWVKFSLENQSVGTLEGISGSNFNTLNGGTVWVQVDTYGGAAVILTSSDVGTSNVVAGLYATPGSDSNMLGNQHYFRVFWLKFEKLTLGDVPGKRVGHNIGLWDPPNPYNPANDTTTQTLNVSQDALLRARVSGWFTNSNPSVRPVRLIDPTNSTLDFTPTAPGTATLTLPAGRWILPDDWAALAGPNWTQSRMHWDIMNTPDGTSGSYSRYVKAGGPIGQVAATYNYAYLANSTGTPPPTNALKAINDAGDMAGIGNYYKIKTNTQGASYVPPPLLGIKILYGDRIAAYKVVGPFAPGLELMTPVGYTVPNPGYDPIRAAYTNQTVVPDGNLNTWDAPMPAAKIIFQIQTSTDTKAKAGYFKWADKTDIYYIWIPDPTNAVNPDIKVYTNPFYQILIPAHQAIPAFINNGGYDWNSFDSAYGPYVFWKFINQSHTTILVPTTDPSGHPTAVEVYSDNHGEAMVWLNGNWNLDLTQYGAKGTADVPYMAQVGQSTIQATADYPYSRAHQAIQSNKDTKTFTWGGLILGTDVHEYGNNTFSNGTATRLVMAAGAWDPSSVIGTYPNQSALSLNKIAWLFVSDRDGRVDGVLGARVDWLVAPQTGAGAHIMDIDTNGFGVSQYNQITKGINLAAGYLTGTNGMTLDPTTGRHNGVSYLKKVSDDVWVKALFNKFFGNGYTENATTYPPTSSINGLDPNNFCVAAIDVTDEALVPGSLATVTATIHSHDFDLANQPNTADSTVVYKTQIDFATADPLDDGMRAGDANCDGVVNMADVTKAERMILGLDKVTSNAVLNGDGTVDMGTVVKIERSILGLNK